MTTMKALLEIESLHAGYGATPVLHGVDLGVGAGEAVALLGRNGMGKTTLVRAVMGLVAVRSGRIAFAGEPIAGEAVHRIARRGIGLVPEGRQVFPNLSVEEHLSAFRRAPSESSREEWSAERVFALFPSLAARRDHLGHQLSGGEQQMLAIGRALVTHPRLLILDEATEGLAPQVREEIWRCLAALREQRQSILVIDKYVERLVALADRHVILEKGRVAWCGTSAELDADRRLWVRYLGV
jgi:branched-chain amino acid transport system ATP-binding protein